MPLTPEQEAYLLSPILPSRVASRTVSGKTLSYLEHQDVRAALSRVFGIGAWSLETLGAVLAYEDERTNDEGFPNGRYDVGYRVTVALRIFATEATYSDSAVGFATNLTRGEAHDMAIKTAFSDALKRCAINLGDAFGLSLYNGGSLRAFVERSAMRTRAQIMGAPESPSEAPTSPVAPETPPPSESVLAAQVAAQEATAEDTAPAEPSPEAQAAINALAEAGILA